MHLTATECTPIPAYHSVSRYGAHRQRLAGEDFMTCRGCLSGEQQEQPPKFEAIPCGGRRRYSRCSRTLPVLSLYAATTVVTAAFSSLLLLLLQSPVVMAVSRPS